MHPRFKIAEIKAPAISAQAADRLRILSGMEKNLPYTQAMTLARRIRPIISGDDPEDLSLSVKGKPSGQKFWVKSSKIRNGSYLLPIRVIAPAKGLKLIGEIDTYHECSACGSFRPSVFEVLYQIPEELRERVTAFELYAEDSCWLNIYDAETDRQKLKCLLYEGAMPERIKKLPLTW